MCNVDNDVGTQTSRLTYGRLQSAVLTLNGGLAFHEKACFLSVGLYAHKPLFVNIFDSVRLHK